MEITIKILLIINLVLQLLFYMHMFQLNSYFIKKYFNWLKVNIKKVIVRSGLVSIPFILLLIRNSFATQIISVLIWVLSIIVNFPKRKAKISLKYTTRVIRMLITEGIIVAIIYGLWSNYVALEIINILAFLLCALANIINFPIEHLVRAYYINDAKRILKSMPNLQVIGVTGSYGKTSVKNFLAKTLSAKYEVFVTQKNYNTTLGVVRAIREQLKPIHQIFICEMGATKVGDIKEICDLVNPTIGVITSIGPQHLQSFKNMDNIVKTKFELYDAVNKNGGITFLNFDNEYIRKQKKKNIIKYGVNDQSLDYSAMDLKSSQDGLTFTVNDINFKTKLIGKHNIENITGAIAVANHLGVSLESLVPRIREIESVEHRLQLIKRGDLNIIDDAYNSNPVSSKSAIDTLAEFEGIKIIVTPGLIELGDNEKTFNKEFGEYMSDVCDYIFIVNSTVSNYVVEGIKNKKYNEEKIVLVNKPEEAIARITSLNLKKQVTVLLENDLPDNYHL